MDFRPVLFIIGILVSTLAVAMFVPTAVDLAAALAKTCPQDSRGQPRLRKVRIITRA